MGEKLNPAFVNNPSKDEKEKAVCASSLSISPTMPQ